MLEFNNKMTSSELDLAIQKLSDILETRIKTSDLDHLCSDLIASGVISQLGDIASTINYPLHNIVNDKKKMFYIMNTRFIIDSLAKAMRPLYIPSAQLMFCCPQSKRENAEIMCELICEDLNAFCCWCIMHGADSGSLRRAIRAKEQKIISDSEKKFGKMHYISYLARAACAYNSVIDTVIRPACNRLMSGTDSRSVNSMADALTSLKSSPSDGKRRTETNRKFSSFAELANRKSA